MSIILFIVFGIVAGFIARAIMPGKQGMGIIMTALLGIAGSFVGGFLGQALMGRGNSTAGWIGSVVGAMALLLAYRAVTGRRHLAPPV